MAVAREFAEEKKPLTPTKKINIQSLDFDGCLFSREFLLEYSEHSKDEKSIDEFFFKIHDKFFKNISQKNIDQKFDENIVMIGSNRQCYFSDMSNWFKCGNKIGSCFPWLPKIRDHLNNKIGKPHFRMDTFLMSDLYQNVPEETNFKNILESKATVFETKWKFDDTKFTLLYTQIHRAAFANPNAEITFDFYDDRHDIISQLYFSFHKHPHLLPKNITLNLHLYDGVEAYLSSSTPGKGEVDLEFASTVKEIAQLSPLPDGRIKPELDLILKLKPGPAPIKSNDTSWSLRPEVITTALGATIGFFATGGIGGIAVGAFSGLMTPGAIELAQNAKCCKK